MRTDPKFIVYAPRYRDDSGGSIVTHKLCDILNKLGHAASIWPLWKPRLSFRTHLSAIPPGIAYYGGRIYRGPYTTNTLYETPIAKPEDIDSSIVVYPEVVSGNPLGAKRYVRWFLHKPGFHEGRFKYADEDLCFFYQDAFSTAGDGIRNAGALTIVEQFLDIYKYANTGNREKTCYMVRKGKNRQDMPNLEGQWVVDGYSHVELAKAFNTCRFCYFYDPYTMYAAYAAVCGCIPIVVPLAGVTKEQWVPEEHLRLGVAYGEDDIPHAVSTRSLLIENLHKIEERNIASAKRFVSVVHDFFE